MSLAATSRSVWLQVRSAVSTGTASRLANARQARSASDSPSARHGTKTGHLDAVSLSERFDDQRLLVVGGVEQLASGLVGIFAGLGELGEHLGEVDDDYQGTPGKHIGSQRRGARVRVRFLIPLSSPCVRFSRTRLSDDLLGMTYATPG